MEIPTIASVYHQLTPAEWDYEIKEVEQDKKEHPEDASIDDLYLKLLYLGKDKDENPQNIKIDQVKIDALLLEVEALLHENPQLMDGKDFSCPAGI